MARIFNDLTLEITAGGARPADAVLPGAAAGPGRRLRRAGPLPGGRATPGWRSATTSATGTSTTPGVVTFLQHCAQVGRAGLRAPLGHAGRPAAGPLDGALAHRHAGRDAPVGAGADPRRGLRPGAGVAADLLRPRRRQLPVLAGPGRQRLAPARRPGPGRLRRARPAPTSTASTSTRWSSTPPALRLLVETIGEDRVLLGSDYPYPLGERPVGQVIRESDFLTEGQRTKLRSANALRFLGR